MTQTNDRPVPGNGEASGHLKVASLFSGAGGMDLGFRGGFTTNGEAYGRLPFDIVWANDMSAAACKTYTKNLGEAIHCGDVWEHSTTCRAVSTRSSADFPCQDVSINGKREGLAGKRTSSYEAMVKAIAEIKPRVFVAENVKGLLQDKGAMAKVLADFSGLVLQPVVSPVSRRELWRATDARARLYRGHRAAREAVSSTVAYAPTGRLGDGEASRERLQRRSKKVKPSTTSGVGRKYPASRATAS